MRLSLAPFLLTLAAAPLEAQTRFSVEIFLGTAMNATTPLTLRQDGEADLELDADYASEAFKTPPYYAIRLALQRTASSWELQFIHHKLHLENPPPEVEHFEISHGFNILTVNYAYSKLPVDLRGGAGVTIPHPEGTVRGERYESEGGLFGAGYRLSGPALTLGVGKRFPLGSHFFISGDVQGIAAWADVPVTGGSVKASSVALHLLAGGGYAF